MGATRRRFMIDVFVSYAREDKERARRLVEQLESHGLAVWWDQEIATGQGWLRATSAKNGLPRRSPDSRPRTRGRTPREQPPLRWGRP